MKHLVGWLMYFGLCRLQLAPDSFHSLIVTRVYVLKNLIHSLPWKHVQVCSFSQFQGCNQFYPLCCLRYELVLSEYWHKGHIQKAHVRFQGEMYSMLNRTICIHVVLVECFVCIHYRRARARPLGRVRRASKGILHTMFLYIPYSISRLCALILSLVVQQRDLAFLTKSRYGSLSNPSFILL